MQIFRTVASFALFLPLAPGLICRSSTLVELARATSQVGWQFAIYIELINQLGISCYFVVDGGISWFELWLERWFNISLNKLFGRPQ